MTTKNKNPAAFDVPEGKRRRLFLISAAVVLVVSAAMHASAFGRVIAAVSRSDLENFMAQGLKVLWLADSAVQLVLAFIFARAGFRSRFISRFGIATLAVIPAVIAALLYFYIGNFAGAHLLAAASLLVAISVAGQES